MLNVSPIGRNCSQEERDEFEKYDKVMTYFSFYHTRTVAFFNLKCYRFNFILKICNDFSGSEHTLKNGFYTSREVCSS